MSDSLNSKKIKIAIVAGEKSGDELGGPLMESLKVHFQDISFINLNVCIDEVFQLNFFEILNKFLVFLYFVLKFVI